MSKGPIKNPYAYYKYKLDPAELQPALVVAQLLLQAFEGQGEIELKMAGQKACVLPGSLIGPLLDLTSLLTTREMGSVLVCDDVEYVTLSQAATALSVSSKQIREWADEGKLPFHLRGTTKKFFRMSELVTFATENSSEVELVRFSVNQQRQNQGYPHK